ncbi:pyruvate/2-oxoglutarate dehydrogenase complex dihydrolipoamide dehydrogenase (E3) component [Actinomycetospora cinnamomea]|uniref:Probable soluble pyridine nucleotide transhydrogenase n=2 Tax=Actinomycetospora cinnamomea TaxID=663609 RepID=A0A2U1FQ33_9PSEU|nr:pyruvate/2-oxoglutarate dehydrogenase complex dihydrolipoamide dehydrogenase (E3) component [Actinomycetospora cinnamomea]
MIGGVCTQTGTIPSKTLREAVLYLTGYAMRGLYGESYRVKQDITVQDLLARTHFVIGREEEVIRAQLQRNRVDLYSGAGRFLDEHTVEVLGEQLGERSDGRVFRGEHQTITAERIVIATGTRPARPSQVEFDDHRVVDSDGILAMERIPSSMVVVGAGVIGIEYASMFAALGTRVTVVERRPTMLDFCDAEVVESLKFHLRDLAVTFRFGEEVAGVAVSDRGTITTLASGKKIPAETVMYSAGRQGVTDELGVARAGLEADARGRLKVDEHFRTAVPHIYAVGDVIGFPALAATSMEQGRQAAYHAFGEQVHSAAGITPFGIYTFPEVSYCGATEAELTEAAIPYEVGISRYRELARGQIVGDDYGMLKLLVSPESHALLGVHVFGTSATELVHVGQAIMGCGGTVDYLVDAVLNYPTLSEAYKVAALDATNKIRALEQFA